MIFRFLPYFFIYIFSCQLSAKTEYESIENGQIQVIQNRLYTKIILDGDSYSRNRNRLSIAKLLAQKQFLLYPYKNIDWNDNYTAEEKRLLIKNYLRLIKIKATIYNLKTHKIWMKDSNYQHVFSIPKFSSSQTTPSFEEIISHLRKSVLENNIKIDYIEMLEINLRYLDLFNIKHIVKSINNRYGSKLLKFMSGEDSLDRGIWNGEVQTLASLNLEGLLSLQSQYTHNHNISYYLAVSLQKHGLDNLMRRVVENSLRNKSDLENYQNLISLAEILGIPVSEDLD